MSPTIAVKHRRHNAKPRSPKGRGFILALLALTSGPRSVVYVPCVGSIGRFRTP
jgi:hypothetical protein